MQFYLGNMLLVGLTRANVEKLTTDNPIHFRVHDSQHVKEIAIIFGEDKPAILDQLEKNGMQIPLWMRETAMKEPT